MSDTPDLAALVRAWRDAVDEMVSAQDKAGRAETLLWDALPEAPKGVIIAGRLLRRARNGHVNSEKVEVML